MLHSWKQNIYRYTSSVSSEGESIWHELSSIMLKNDLFIPIIACIIVYLVKSPDTIESSDFLWLLVRFYTLFDAFQLNRRARQIQRIAEDEKEKNKKYKENRN